MVTSVNRSIFHQIFKINFFFLSHFHKFFIHFWLLSSNNVSNSQIITFFQIITCLREKELPSCYGSSLFGCSFFKEVSHPYNFVLNTYKICNFSIIQNTLRTTPRKTLIFRQWYISFQPFYLDVLKT